MAEHVSAGSPDSHSAESKKNKKRKKGKKKDIRVAENTRAPTDTGNKHDSSGSLSKRVQIEIERLKLEIERVKSTSDGPESSESMERRVSELLKTKLKQLKEENRIATDLLDEQKRKLARNEAILEELRERRRQARAHTRALPKGVSAMEMLRALRR